MHSNVTINWKLASLSLGHPIHSRIGSGRVGVRPLLISNSKAYVLVLISNNLCHTQSAASSLKKITLSSHFKNRSSPPWHLSITWRHGTDLTTNTVVTGLLPHSLTVGPMRRPGAAAAASTRAMTSLNHRNNRTAHALITERRGDSQRDNIRITGGLRHRHRGHSCSVTCTECRGGVETVFHVGVYFRTKMHLTSWNP